MKTISRKMAIWIIIVIAIIFATEIILGVYFAQDPIDEYAYLADPEFSDFIDEEYEKLVEDSVVTEP